MTMRSFAKNVVTNTDAVVAAGPDHEASQGEVNPRLFRSLVHHGQKMVLAEILRQPGLPR